MYKKFMWHKSDGIMAYSEDKCFFLILEKDYHNIYAHLMQNI